MAREERENKTFAFYGSVKRWGKKASIDYVEPEINGKRPTGRPRKRWLHKFYEQGVLRWNGFSKKGDKEIKQDSGLWPISQPRITGKGKTGKVCLSSKYKSMRSEDVW